MSITEFQDMPLNHRAEVLWNGATYLETTIYYGYTVKLYSISSFFVEVYFSSFTMMIEKIDIANEMHLKKYLAGIKLE